MMTVMTDVPPGQPGHGRNTTAGISLVPGSEGQYTFFCAACDNAGVPYDSGPYELEEARARLDLHRGANTWHAQMLDDDLA
jgi:hypothetical protein